jgi:hypothetical protein
MKYTSTYFYYFFRSFYYFKVTRKAASFVVAVAASITLSIGLDNAWEPTVQIKKPEKANAAHEERTRISPARKPL